MDDTKTSPALDLDWLLLGHVRDVTILSNKKSTNNKSSKSAEDSPGTYRIKKKSEKSINVKNITFQSKTAKFLYFFVLMKLSTYHVCDSI